MTLYIAPDPDSAVTGRHPEADEPLLYLAVDACGDPVGKISADDDGRTWMPILDGSDEPVCGPSGTFDEAVRWMAVNLVVVTHVEAPAALPDD